MINQLLAIKIARHDFSQNNPINFTGFFPAKEIMYNNEKIIFRQGDVYKLSFENREDTFHFVKFIHNNGFFKKGLLVDLEDIILNNEAHLFKNSTFELLEGSQSIEYIGNFIEDDIPTIFNILSNYQERFRENIVFEGLLKRDNFSDYFYNYFDKDIQDMVFHLDFIDTIFTFKDFEKIILEIGESNIVVKNLRLREVNFFNIYPLCSLYDGFGENRMPIFTPINSLLKIEDKSFLTLLDKNTNVKVYDMKQKKIIMLYQLKNIIADYIANNDIKNEKESNIRNTYFSNNSIDYVYAIEDLDFKKIYSLVK